MQYLIIFFTLTLIADGAIKLTDPLDLQREWRQEVSLIKKRAKGGPSKYNVLSRLIKNRATVCLIESETRRILRLPFIHFEKWKDSKRVNQYDHNLRLALLGYYLDQRNGERVREIIQKCCPSAYGRNDVGKVVAYTSIDYFEFFFDAYEKAEDKALRGRLLHILELAGPYRRKGIFFDDKPVEDPDVFVAKFKKWFKENRTSLKINLRYNDGPTIYTPLFLK